jgi:hypothetical protein
MGDFTAFVEIAGAILTGLGLAMSLEWLTLNWLLRLMPAAHEPKLPNALPATSSQGPNRFSPR